MRRPHPDAARIISAHGRQAWVQTRLGGLALCHLKGRDLEPLANDWVQVDDPDRPTVVTDLLERRNTLYRQEGQKIKALAANLDLVLIVLAGEPRFAPDAISRLMASLIEQSIDFQIVLNKADLPEALATANELIATFQPVAPCRPWPVVQTSTREPKGLEALARVLQPLARADDQACVALVGQSGMGKSSLLNRLVPDAEAQTNAISTALQSGRHTTTASRVYQAKTEGGLGLQIVDTPGFQRFGISHLQRDDLERIFPEWAQISEELGRCRFVNCSHDHEPDCQIQFKISQLLDSQSAAGQQLESRRQQWLRLLQASS